MKHARRVVATATVIALAAAPSGAALGSSSHAGQHGNHCGLGHAKHVKGQGGLKAGQSCVKAPNGDGDTGGVQ